MNLKLESALIYTRQGIPVFPGVPNKKIPAILNPYEQATLNEEQVRTWWQENDQYNICVPGGIEYEAGKWLGHIDFDLKDARNGFETAEFLKDLGMDFPETRTSETPSGGVHLTYWFDYPIANGVNSIGPGIDVRGFHGYVMGVESTVNGKKYVARNNFQILRAPRWLSEMCRERKHQSGPLPAQTGVLADQGIATRQATEFLSRLGAAEQGERNHAAFKAAAGCRDFGLFQAATTELMSTHWKAEPPLEPEELEAAVNSAFRYAKDTAGNKSPAAAFSVIEEPPKAEEPKPPLMAMNDKYAFITIGSNSRILWNTTDIEGRPETRTLTIEGFHQKLLPFDIFTQGKTQQLSELWMKCKGRRTYDGVVFEPGKTSERFYNTWHGFSVEPYKAGEVPTPTAVRAVEIFKEHIAKNVALGDKAHANWIFAWFAHIFQKPWEKPRTALVLRGGKGIGKSAIFKCVSKLLGVHYLSVAHRRYLTGNFNAHLEGKILYVLEEAFWAKDKNAEGVLKDLVTSETVQIERKGQESYPSKNLCRVAILGNEEWIVPTSEDERRYAVFDVAKTNRNDENFFAAFNEDMDHRLLYKFFMEFDLSLANINKIPKTNALLKQKEQSAEPLAQWWGECIREGAIGDIWPTTIPRDTIRRMFTEEMKSQNNRGKLPAASEIGKFFRKALPSLSTKKVREGELVTRTYVFPDIETAKKEWASYMEAVYEPPPEEEE